MRGEHGGNLSASSTDLKLANDSKVLGAECRDGKAQWHPFLDQLDRRITKKNGKLEVISP